MNNYKNIMDMVTSEYNQNRADFLRYLEEREDVLKRNLTPARLAKYEAGKLSREDAIKAAFERGRKQYDKWEDEAVLKLEAVRRFLPHGEDLEKLPEKDREIITDFDITLLSLYKKGKTNSERARVYISEKRALDPSFGREKSYKEARAKREKLREANKKEFFTLCNHFKKEEV